MYYNDHAPPHFHAAYGEARASIAVAAAEVLDGWLPARAVQMVRDCALHEAELRDNWQLAREHLPLRSIEPLL